LHQAKEATVEEPEIELSKTEARGGVTPHIVRYVLGASLILVIVAMIFIVMFPAK
jgi:hypothetical protein